MLVTVTAFAIALVVLGTAAFLGSYVDDRSLANPTVHDLSWLLVVACLVAVFAAAWVEVDVIVLNYRVAKRVERLEKYLPSEAGALDGGFDGGR